MVDPSLYLEKIIKKVRSRNEKRKIRDQVLIASYEKYLQQKIINPYEVRPFFRLVPPIPASVLLNKEQFFLIAECKKTSPSKGLIRADFDPVFLAQEYVAGGAKAISVLAEEDFFKGSEEYVKQVKKKLISSTKDVSVLWKDFVIDRSQVLRAYFAGADWVLLIARILDEKNYLDFLKVIVELGMTPLVEVFDVDELKWVIDVTEKTGLLKSLLLGVNNRDLKTFEVNLNQSIVVKDYLQSIGLELPLISESGISSYQEIKFLKKNQFAGVLVGESLLRYNDVRKATHLLLNEK